MPLPAPDARSAPRSAGSDGTHSGRSNAIDWMRAVSVLWIVGFWHMADYLPDVGDHKNFVTTRITIILLALFVLISGYLMGRQDIPLTGEGLRRFYIRRFGRIYPPFLVAIVMFAVIGISSRLALLKGAVLVVMLWGPPPLTLWFIAMICLFYVITPLLLVARRRPRWFFAAVVLVGALLAVSSMALSVVDPRPAIYFPAYCAGLWLARPGRALPPVRPWLLVALFAGLVFSFVMPAHGPLDANLAVLPLAVGGAVVMFVAAMRHDMRLPGWQAVQVLSFAGYFMYLFHRPIYVAVERAAAGLSAGSATALFVGVGVPLVVFASWSGQRLYDRAWVWLTRAPDAGSREQAAVATGR